MISKGILSLATLLLLIPSFSSADDDTVNIRIDPISLLVGVINAGADFKIAEHWTLGVELGYLSVEYNNDEIKVNQYGLRAQYFFREALTDSWYLAPFAKYASASGRDTLNNTTATATGTAYGAIAGYMWRWAHFNMQLGGGFQVISLEAEGSSATTTVSFTDVNNTYPALEFNLGWAF